MASAHQSDEETSSEIESDSSDESDTDGSSDEEAECQSKGKEPCKFYNSGKCQDGDKCSYLHVCKYALKGNCRKGSKCNLKHPRGGRQSSSGRRRTSDGSTSPGPKLTDGRRHQWQLNDGQVWLDVANDHVIEAQYSLPHTKSIQIYNTPYGAVSIDFKRMSVYRKSLKVRRLDDGKTSWIWYCTLSRKWIKYGDKDSKGKVSPVKSSDIEAKFQSNPASSFSFNIGADTCEIKFKEMQQVTAQGKRKVSRRPLYQQQPAGAAVSQATSAFQNLSVSARAPQWQFEGGSGAWHEYKRRRGTSTECSTTSDAIETNYQRNTNGSMTFKVNAHSYKLDFTAMIQTNLKTNQSRKIRRVLV
ncbi:uncharacterized protein LOC115028539 isoform X2 [Cottoperca gobio]|uniref:Uncharacterized protein LOC115028539 isoform X2 n=1 Tax=Cottoperca gobio TaxID=56716 RepID=A0A6J2S8F9_COTGO|nr:uncharacterized protein LOC115028539 isoform X2 [Cottoperca gobio]